MSDGIPSPNPDFPQPIKNVTGSANVKIQNKNLFNSVWEQGAINSATGDNEWANAVIRTKDYIPVIPGNRYSISRTISTSFMNLRCYDKNKNYIGNGTYNINLIVGYSAGNPMYIDENFCVIEPKENVYYLRLNDQSNNLSTQYMMVQGQYTAETMPSYVPHQEQNLPFTFAEGQFLADDGKLQENGIYNEFQKIIFDGTENVLPYEVGDDYDGFAIKIKNTYLRNAGDRTSQKYNYFIELGHSPAYGRQPNKATMGTDGYLYVFFEKNVMANATAVQTWLANNYANNKPLIAIGKVQNPTPTPYNSTQQAQYNAKKQARSYDDQTNISSTSDELAFKMDVEILSNGVSSSNTRTLALGNLNEVSLNKGSLNNIKEVDTEDTEVAQDASVESEE